MEPLMELIMGGLGAGQRVLGVSEPRADALSILGARAVSLGVIYSILSLIHIELAPDLLLLLYLFISCLSFQAVAVKALVVPLEREAPHGQGSEGCKEQPLPLLMPPLPLHQGWDLLLPPKPWDWALFLLF